MKKITLIHCYSDKNRGDLGILLGTIDTLRKVQSDIQIDGISTFNSKDPYYYNHHEYLKRYINNLYPSIMGRFDSSNKSKIGLFLKLLIDLIRMIFFYYGPFWVLKRILMPEKEIQTLKALMNSDLIISKGGSFLCNGKDLRSKIRLFRLLTEMIVSLRLNKKVIIWGQSIGPVHGILSQRLINSVLKKCHRVILREKDCIDAYPEIEFPADVVIGHDLAFNINTDGVIRTPKNTNLVGLTVKRYDDRKVDTIYTNEIVRIIEYLIIDKNKDIVIIPHVTIGDDLDKAFDIRSRIGENIKDRVVIEEKEYDLDEILQKYQNLDYLIGTRLHSTIFALTLGTKVINISYHGTKSFGVFSTIDLENFVIEGSELSVVKLKEKITDLENFTQRDYNKRLSIAIEQNKNIAKIILSDI